MKHNKIKNYLSILAISIIFFACNTPLTPEQSYNKINEAGLEYELDSLFNYIHENKIDTIKWYLNASKFDNSLFGADEAEIDKNKNMFLLAFTVKACSNIIETKTFEVILEYFNSEDINFFMGDYNPLMLAIGEKSPIITGLLLQNGANENLANESGLTPLFSSINTYNVALIDTILNYAPNVNQPHNDISPLMAVILYSDKIDDPIKIVKKLVNKGANINDKVKVNGTTTSSLFWAIVFDDIELVRFMLKNGANPNLTTNDYSSLILGLDDNSTEMLELLIKYNADDNIYPKNGMPALFFAIRDNQDECLEFLLENSQSPFKKYSVFNGQFSLTAYEVAQEFNNKKAIEILNSKRGSANTKDTNSNNETVYKTFASIEFEGGTGTCKINHNLSVEAIGAGNYVSSIDNFYHTCYIEGFEGNGIKGKYKFTWTYYDQCVNIGEPDGPYTYSSEFYIDGEHSSYTVFVNEYDVEVKGY